jgi:hypothetical protein
VRRGVWNDLGHRDDEFLHEGSWLPKQWYAWRYCCYPGKNFRAFDGKLPSMPSSQQRQRSNNNNNNVNGRNNNINMNGNNDNNEASVNWGAALPINAAQLEAGLSSVVALQLGSHTSSSSHQRSANSAGPTQRTNRANLPNTVANQRLLQAAASMSRVRAHPNANPNPNHHEDELSVQHYLAEVQQYMAQMTRLEKAAALAEAFGEPEKAAGFKRQLYEHVQTDPPGRLKRPNSTSSNQQQSSSSLLIHQNSHSSQSSGNSHTSNQSALSGINNNHSGNGATNVALDTAQHAHSNNNNNHNGGGNINSSLSHSNSNSGSGGGGNGGGSGGEALHSQPVHAHIPASEGGGQSSSSSSSGSSGNNSINNQR